MSRPAFIEVGGRRVRVRFGWAVIREIPHAKPEASISDLMPRRIVDTGQP